MKSRLLICPSEILIGHMCRSSTAELFEGASRNRGRSSLPMHRLNAANDLTVSTGLGTRRHMQRSATAVETHYVSNGQSLPWTSSFFDRFMTCCVSLISSWCLDLCAEAWSTGG